MTPRERERVPLSPPPLELHCIARRNFNGPPVATPAARSGNVPAFLCVFPARFLRIRGNPGYVSDMKSSHCPVNSQMNDNKLDPRD